jgi:hypothetical protein
MGGGGVTLQIGTNLLEAVKTHNILWIWKTKHGVLLGLINISPLLNSSKYAYFKIQFIPQRKHCVSLTKKNCLCRSGRSSLRIIGIVIKHTNMGRHSSVGIAITIRVGRFGDRIPVEARYSAPVQTGPGAHPVSCKMATVSLSRG